MHNGLCFLFLLRFTFFLREVKDNACAFFGVGGRGGEGQTRFFMGDMQMTDCALQ